MRHKKNISAVLVFICLLWGAAMVCPRSTPHDPLKINLSETLSPPSQTYMFGTDELGRDILSRVMVGFSTTIKVSIMALFSSFLIGLVVGSIAGLFYNTLIDHVFNWIASMLFSLPFLLILAGVMSIMEKNLLNAYLVITAIIWISPARIVRAGVIRTRGEAFILAERAMGMEEWRILIRSLMPMSMKPAFIFSFRYFPEIIGLEAGLSFLGLGVQPPHPGLGKMIFDSINYLYSAWWYAAFPAALLFAIVCICNLFSRYVLEGETRNGRFLQALSQ
jgi:peptide/nickel transport system permease protein